MISLIAAVGIALSSLTGMGSDSTAPDLAVNCTTAPEAVIESGGSCGPIRIPAQNAGFISDCGDGYDVFIDPVTGMIYGDQDENGRLDGDDCNWS